MADERIVSTGTCVVPAAWCGPVRWQSVEVGGLKVEAADGSLFDLLTRARSEREIALAAGLSNCLTRLTG